MTARRAWRAALLLLGAAGLGAAWLWAHLPELVRDRATAALAARGVTATFDDVLFDGPTRVVLRGVAGHGRGLRFQARQISARVDWWARRPAAVHIDGLRVQPEAGLAPRIAAPDVAGERRTAGPRFPVTFSDLQADLRLGRSRLKGAARQARLADGALTVDGLHATGILGGRVSLQVRGGTLQADLAGQRVTVDAVDVGWPLQQRVLQAWVQRSPGVWTAGGRPAGLGGQVQATVVGDLARPALVTAEGHGLGAASLLQWARSHRRALPALDGLDAELDVALAVVDPRGEAPVAHATGALRGHLDHPRVAPGPVDVGVTAEAVVARDPATGALDAQVRLSREQASGHVDLHLDGLDRAATLALTATLDPLPCQAAYDAIPKGLLGPYGGARLTGTFAPWVQLTLPLDDPRRLRLRWRGVEGACPMIALGAAVPAQVDAARGDLHDVDWLLHPFQRAVPEASRPLTVGPGHASYVPLSRLPAYVPAVMYLSEDPAFFRHGGVSGHLIQRALMLDLAEGRFVYGGSTLPQQLVKNLFLDRGKTLARKLQEALLAARVADVVPKARILELYLNCIEFAPDVYGIERAAQHYFGVPAARLTPKQAVFLATAKPSPRYAEQLRRRGATPDTAHYRTYMARLFDRLVGAGALTPDQVAAARPFRIEWR
ncbi:MAG: transglycosylase domain-containing protein [Myxococcales bacterium]|nr:transglycosylase domain-containing protein [Myxococcales bacterium]